MTARLLAYLSGKKSLLLQCVIIFAVCLVATGLVKTWIIGIVPVSGGFDFAPRMNGTRSGPALGRGCRTRPGSAAPSAAGARLASFAGHGGTFRRRARGRTCRCGYRAGLTAAGA